MIFIKMKNQNAAFTLVEMLIAMAVTLLMMAALARAFGFVGEKVRDSRADVEMAGRLVDINARMASELSRCTVPLRPALNGDEPLGYFLYSEGPMTDVTSSLFRAFNDAAGNLVLDEARYGDFDDFLAFTAVADGNNWFTGKVPRFILDQKTADLNGVTYDPDDFPGHPLDPIVIRSKYAEIIYFASPEYVASSLPAAPAIVDSDGNGYPDRLNLHRRVLLIRPDLNLSSGAIDTKAINFDGDIDSSGVNWMLADVWPLGSTATNVNTSEAWAFGMAGIHQQCDLSVRRVLNDDGTYTNAVAGNSLEDLAVPHNRFAHIRVPNSVLNGTNTTGSGNDADFPTSMPVLALGRPLAVLGATNSSVAQLAPPLAPNTSSVVTPNRLAGFLRPEFVLGHDQTHREFAGDAWGSERLGEDLLTNNALALDVQIYDPQVALFTTSNSLVVGPNDAGYREALLEKIASTANLELSRGGFVDLAYPVLAGGSLRGWDSRLIDRRATVGTSAVASTGAYLQSTYSGVEVLSSGNHSMAVPLRQSGRLLSIGSQIRLFQPAFDTYSFFYENDGIYQNYNSAGTPGTQWSKLDQAVVPSGVIVDAGSDGLDGDANYGPDDVGERETSPPFLSPAESIKVTIRIENPSTRQVRQASVVHRD